MRLGRVFYRTVPSPCETQREEARIKGIPMSERIMMHRSGDEGTLVVSRNGCEMQLSELRVRSMANWQTPHQLLGKGGSSMALTDVELMQVVAEYLRYSICEPTKHEQSQVTFSFSCEVRK